VTDVFDHLRQSIEALETAIGGSDDADQRVSQRILAERTERIAREPVRVEKSRDALSCLVFQRCGRTYAVPLENLNEVAPIASVAHVPGVLPAFLGVTARRGRVVSVVDVPRLFGTATPDADPPKWLVTTSSTTVVCGVGADELNDVIDVDPGSMAKTMPTFPPLIQRHTLGVLENRTVILDFVGLLEDRALNVEERVK
jgi:chemotaxis signal transduction protein